MLATGKPDYEIRIKGRPIIRIQDGQAQVEGRDYHTDLRNISALIDMLQDIVGTAREAGRPKLVPATDAITLSPGPATTTNGRARRRI